LGIIARYDFARYPTDLADTQWAVLAALILAANRAGIIHSQTANTTGKGDPGHFHVLIASLYPYPLRQEDPIRASVNPDLTFQATI
jgi:hypothetical protein